MYLYWLIWIIFVSLAFVVGLNDSMSGGMQLLPDPLFSIPTDNTYILSITSTDLGRIFMAGKDGCLYEIAYQAEAGWLSQRCRKINHSKSSLSFLIPSVLQFSFSEDGEERDIFPCGAKDDLFTLTFCRPCVPQTPSCRLLSTTPAIHYSHALRRVSCRYDVKWISCQVFTYMDVLDQLRNWQICGDYQCAKIINNLTDYLGIWPGCWWAGNESCGNHVTELHCCGRWKHSQVCVGLSNLKHVFFPHTAKALLPLQDNWSFRLQTHCPDLCDWQVWVLRLSPACCHSCR